MNMLKVIAFVLAVAVGVAFTGQAWALAPVAGPAASSHTVANPLLKKAQEQKQEGKMEKKKKKGKGKKKKKGEGKEEPPK